MLGVNVAVLDAGRILLMQREDFEVWCMPGGHVDPGESLAEAAVREVREETGIEVSLVGLVGTYSRPYWHDGVYHIVLFEGVPIGGSLAPDPVEVIDAAWFPPTELPEQLLIGQRRRIEDALAGRRGIARSSSVGFPFLSREDAYRKRDESGLARAQFYELHMGSLPDDDVLQAGEP